MPLPSLTPEQRQQALEKAAEVRRKRRDLKAQLKNGNQSLAEVLKTTEDDTVGKMKVSAILESLPGVGRVRAQEDHGAARHLRVAARARPRCQAARGAAVRVRGK